MSGVIRDPGVTGKAALHYGILVQVLLTELHKTAHPHTNGEVCTLNTHAVLLY